MQSDSISLLGSSALGTSPSRHSNDDEDNQEPCKGNQRTSPSRHSNTAASRAVEASAEPRCASNAASKPPIAALDSVSGVEGLAAAAAVTPEALAAMAAPRVARRSFASLAHPSLGTKPY